jgi:hypothetical protein
MSGQLLPDPNPRRIQRYAASTERKGTVLFFHGLGRDRNSKRP